MHKILLLLFTIHLSLFSISQDMTTLITKVKVKLGQVNDYVAEGTLKTDVSFIKAPFGKVKVYFKKPDKFKLKKEGGISILPKAGVSVNMNSMNISGNFVALAAGEAMIDNVKTKIVKLLSIDESSEIVLSTLYIDEANLLVRKTVTTTKENGTYEIGLTYGKYSNYGLPDKVVFSFNTRDYKLPKGITLEFNEAQKSSDAGMPKNKKGKVEIIYNSYIINKGVDDSVFK